MNYFDSLLEPVFILSQQGHVLYSNESGALVSGVSVRKILKSKPLFQNLFRFSENIVEISDLVQVDTATPYREISFESDGIKDGRVQVTVQKFEIIDAQQTWLVFFRDVTLEEKLQRKYRSELKQKEDYIEDLQAARVELEKYSKNLEIMVAERTEQLQELNQLLKALLDSLDQGFFLFNKSGKCFGVSSRACLRLIECEPLGKSIEDVLKVPKDKLGTFHKWTTALFSEALPFEDLVPLGPKKFENSNDLNVALNYYPLRNLQNYIEAIVVVSSDITDLVHAHEQAEREKAHVNMIISLVKARGSVQSFIRQGQVLVSEIKKNLLSSTLSFTKIERDLHTLKGGAAGFWIKELEDTCNQTEELLAQTKNEIEQNLLMQKQEQLKSLAFAIEQSFEKFKKENQEIVGGLERQINQTSQIAVADLVSHYEKMIQELALKLGKESPVVAILGTGVMVPAEKFDSLFAVFVHALRNSVDHGLESTQVREALGKNTKGKIEINFEHIYKDKNYLRIKLSDDGAGISPSKIRKKLGELGIPAENESDFEVIQHVFNPNFSTQNEVNEISGRGIGMNALKDVVEQMGGQVWVESVVNQGTAIFIEVPS